MSSRYYPIILVLGFTNGSASADWFQNQSQQAEKAFQQQDYQTATQLFTDPYQKGVALYRAGKYAEAAQSFAASTRPEVKLDALYNLGNAYFQQGKYSEAMAAYDKVLTAQPAMEEAKHNLALAKQQLEQPQAQSQSQSSPSPQDSATKSPDNHSPQNQGESNQPTTESAKSANPGSAADHSPKNPSEASQQPQPTDSTNNSASPQSSGSGGHDTSSVPTAASNQTPLANEQQTNSTATPDPALFSKDKVAQEDAAAVEENPAPAKDTTGTKTAMEKSTESPNRDSKQTTQIQGTDHGLHSNSKENPMPPPIGMSEGATSKLEMPSETETMANVLLNRIKDEPRQLLKAQFYIDAYSAKQKGDNTDRPW